MNIFYLDREPEPCAEAHCDRHSVKMPVEYAQLLSTAHIELDGEQVAYRATHRNHPSAVWVRQSSQHYDYVYQLMVALGNVYADRYGRIHKTLSDHTDTLANPPVNLPDNGWVDPPQCMPDDCKRDDAVLGYQVYYNYKADDWDARGIPMRWYGREAV
jgi:hypothetical protein